LTLCFTATEAGSAEQKRLIERKRNIIILIHQHLVECGKQDRFILTKALCDLYIYSGYLGAAEALQAEAGVAASKFEVADNMDLTLILSEYEAYYEMKFDKKPKIVRKLTGVEDGRMKAPRQPDPSKWTC
jgi:katanin p60 ATPase-containing subunit A1